MRLEAAAAHFDHSRELLCKQNWSARAITWSTCIELLLMIERGPKTLHSRQCGLDTLQVLAVALAKCKAFMYIPHENCVLSHAKYWKKNTLEWNLSVADMLYSGHLFIADTIHKNRWNHGHSLIEKPLSSGQK